jgi:AAA family ATP:ADP antiporter
MADFKLDLIAQLFNPDRLIREMGAWALYEINPEAYEINARRLGADGKRWLDRSVIPDARLKLRLFEKIVFFQSLAIFEGVSGLALSFVSDISKELRLAKGEFMSIDEKANNDFFIVYSGTVQYYEKSVYEMDYTRGQFIGEIIAPVGFANTNIIIAKTDTILLKINKDEFYELMADNISLTGQILEYI